MPQCQKLCKFGASIFCLISSFFEPFRLNLVLTCKFAIYIDFISSLEAKNAVYDDFFSRGLPIKVDFWCALEKYHFLGNYFLINEQKSNLVHNSALYSLVPSESLGNSGLITEEIR